MPRMPADPVGRLTVLEAARSGVEPGLILNFGEMAKVAGMTARNLKLTINSDPGFPIVSQGGEGVPWEFDAAAVLDHLISSARTARAAREARMAEVTRLAGLGNSAAATSPGGGDSTEPGSAAAMKEAAQAISAIVDAQTKVRAQKQSEHLLVDRAQVESLLVTMMTTMQSETLAIASRMDPAGQWDPVLRAGVEEELRNVLVGVRNKLEKTIAEWRGSQP